MSWNENIEPKFNEIKEIIESNGGTLISKEYKNYKTPIYFICGFCKNCDNLTYHNLVRSKGYCPNCRYNRSHLNRTKDEKIIIQELESKGLSLDSKYLNAHTPLSLICKCGRKFNRAYSKFKTNGYYCKDCKLDNIKINKIKEYYKIFEAKNCKILNMGKYQGKLTEFTFECKCGIIATRNVQEFKKKPHCKSCAKKIAKKNLNLSLTEVNQIIRKNSKCELLNSYYEDRNTLLRLKCHCGDQFETYLDRFLVDKKRQCNTCGINKRSGENNPNWRGGVTDENSKIRQSKEYVIWRDSTFKRDEYTCKCCNDSSGGNLHAHHINGFAEHIDKRFDLTNSITLCSLCHNPSSVGSFHNTYGTKNNDIEQLQDYIDDIRSHLSLPLYNIENYIIESTKKIDKNS